MVYPLEIILSTMGIPWESLNAILIVLPEVAEGNTQHEPWRPAGARDCTPDGKNIFSESSRNGQIDMAQAIRRRRHTSIAATRLKTTLYACRRHWHTPGAADGTDLPSLHYKLGANIKGIRQPCIAGDKHYPVNTKSVQCSQ